MLRCAILVSLTSGSCSNGATGSILALLRWASALLGLALGVGAVTAQEASDAWFDRLGFTQRADLQTYLILAGFYDGLVDGQFGPGTLRAIRQFEMTVGDVADNELDDREMGELEKVALQRIDALGLGSWTDPSSGLTFPLAGKLLSVSGTSGGDSVFRSSDGDIRLTTWRVSLDEESFEATFARRVAGPNRTISYSQLGDTSFVVAGKDASDFFYTRGLRSGTTTAGYTIRYGEKYRSVGSMLAILLASYARITPDSDNAMTDDRGQVASGSGFFINDKGLALTNYHVVEACSEIEIIGYGNAMVLKSDPSVDLAVLQTEKPTQTHWAGFRTGGINLGEAVVLAGYPLADLLDDAFNVSTGVVSSLTGPSQASSWFTTSAGIQPGNSGGPILDRQGAVVGVAVAKLNDVTTLSEIGTVASSVGFGIRNADILRFLRIVDHEELTSGPVSEATIEAVAADARAYTVRIECRVD